MLKKLSFILSSLFMATVLSAADAQKPGNETMLKQKISTVKLFVGAVAIQDQEVKGLGLLWAPASVNAACVGKSAETCAKLVGKKGETPSRVLSTWLNDRAILTSNKKALERVNSLATSSTAKQKAGLMGSEIHLDTLDNRYAVTAEVRWELWSNGENFTVLKILQ
jgi:hypothetical protein